jgi:hypothetical protein
LTLSATDFWVPIFVVLTDTLVVGLDVLTRNQSAQIRTRLISTLDAKLSRPETFVCDPQGVTATAGMLFADGNQKRMAKVAAIEIKRRDCQNM